MDIVLLFQGTIVVFWDIATVRRILFKLVHREEESVSFFWWISILMLLFVSRFSADLECMNVISGGTASFMLYSTIVLWGILGVLDVVFRPR